MKIKEIVLEDYSVVDGILEDGHSPMYHEWEGEFILLLNNKRQTITAYNKKYIREIIYE